MGNFKQFRMLNFFAKKEFRDSKREITIKAYIPGVNSGVYDKTLHFYVRITEEKAGFFRFKKTTLVDSITLTKLEFEALKEEILKIDNLQN